MGRVREWEGKMRVGVGGGRVREGEKVGGGGGSERGKMRIRAVKETAVPYKLYMQSKTPL